MLGLGLGVGCSPGLGVGVYAGFGVGIPLGNGVGWTKSQYGFWQHGSLGSCIRTHLLSKLGNLEHLQYEGKYKYLYKKIVYQCSMY